MSQKRKCQNLTLHTKAEILHKHLYDKVKIIELATEYNIPASTITTWKKHAGKILKDVGHLSNKRKWNKISPDRDVKHGLLYWLKDSDRDMCHPLLLKKFYGQR